jgi:hypothetical protein
MVTRFVSDVASWREAIRRRVGFVNYQVTAIGSEALCVWVYELQLQSLMGTGKYTSTQSVRQLPDG